MRAISSRRLASSHFPIPEVSAEVLRRYFLEGGRPPGIPYRPVPMYKQVVSRVRHQLTMMANFCEVWLAKEGHDGKVGINLLTKVQMPNLGSLYGAMLAGVDYVLMGAGIPREIPGVLDRFAEHRAASLKLDVEGAEAQVLRGMGPLLGGDQAILISTHSRGLYEQCRRILGERGFRVHDSWQIAHRIETGAPWSSDHDLLAIGSHRELPDDALEGLDLLAGRV